MTEQGLKTSVASRISVDVLGVSLTLATDDRLFSPRGLDAGTRFMLETAEVSPSDRVLDLGCGYGVVGLVLAKRYHPQSVVMVDSDPVAIQVARRNVEDLGSTGVGTELRVLQSDGFEGLQGETFTVILSNPPYHTDFAVARRFIEDGFAHLELGGRLYMVVKRRTWYENKLRSVFGGVKVEERNGYYVMMSEKRSPKSPRPRQAKATTAKHAKRQVAAAKRHRR